MIYTSSLLLMTGECIRGVLKLNPCLDCSSCIDMSMLLPVWYNLPV